MINLILRRLWISVLTVWAIVTGLFFLIRLLGDPVKAALAGSGATGDQIAQVRAELGYDDPLFIQYIDFLRDALHGDFGSSFVYGTDALEVVLSRVPHSLALAGVGIIILIVVGVPLGMACGVYRDTFFDRLCSGFFTLGQGVPEFVSGPLLILVFSVLIPVFPISGTQGTLSIVLPGVTLALFPIARVGRLLRASVIDTSDRSFVDGGRFRGLKASKLLISHVLPNSVVPLVTLLGIEIVEMIGGAVVVENVFSWPGIGSLAQDVLINLDYPVVMVIIVFVSILVVVVNTLVDVAYGLIDPRIRV